MARPSKKKRIRKKASSKSVTRTRKRKLDKKANDKTRSLRGSTTKSLTPKMDRFVSEYLVDFNGTQAAIRAGYSKSSAAEIAYETLRKPQIQEAMSERAATVIRSADVDALRVLEELGKLSTSDLRELFDANGNLLPIMELPDSVAPAVSSVEVVKRMSDDEADPEYIHKVRLWDKNTALTNLAKHFGLLKELIEIKDVTDPLEGYDFDLLSESELEQLDQLLTKAAVREE